MRFDVAAGSAASGAQAAGEATQAREGLEVLCVLVSDAVVRTESLAENVQREAIHSADQVEAFAALAAEDQPIEDIAADFDVTPLVVQRRHKLANVSLRLLVDRGSAREALGLDMRDWWAPTAASHFAHVSKAKTLEAVQVFAPDRVARLAKLKKNDLASEAERLAALLALIAWSTKAEREHRDSLSYYRAI